MKQPKFDRRLQKAVNHTNKTLKRLYQLDEMEEPAIVIGSAEGDTPKTIWWFLAQEYEGLRRRLLFAAEMRGVAIDGEGMPR